MTTPETTTRRRRPYKGAIRREVVSFKASSEEKERWQRAAEGAGMSLGAWLARLADLASQAGTPNPT